MAKGKLPRAYCSTDCEIADIRRQAVIQADSESRTAFSEWVVSLWLGGYRRKAVREALNISNTTLRYWIKVHTGKVTESQRRHWCVNDFRKAENPDEWLRILREDVIPPEGKGDFIDGRQVFLISGAVKWLGCADSLSSVVYGRLQMNPFDGSVYVFCNANFDKIRCLYSNGTVLSVLTHIRERGKYLWPQRKVGAVVSATPQDLELILHGGHKRLVMRKDDWDKIRL